MAKLWVFFSPRFCGFSQALNVIFESQLVVQLEEIQQNHREEIEI
jgi:hypothetical protein